MVGAEVGILNQVDYCSLTGLLDSMKSVRAETDDLREVTVKFFLPPYGQTPQDVMH